MKKQLLLLTGILFGAFMTQAQCTITPSCTAPSNTGYCTEPTSGSTLPPATIMVPYTTTVQVSVGTTAGNGAITINSVSIVGATMPNGLNYEQNPISGISGGQNGCIEISGTPLEWSASPMTIILDVMANTSAGMVPATLEFEILISESTASLNEESNIGLAVSPNPANDVVSISVSKPQTITICNMLGQTVANFYVHDSITIDVSNWKNSIYFITESESGTTVKFIKK